MLLTDCAMYNCSRWWISTLLRHVTLSFIGAFAGFLAMVDDATSPPSRAPRLQGRLSRASPAARYGTKPLAPARAASPAYPPYPLDATAAPPSHTKSSIMRQPLGGREEPLAH